jgi:hypothetical protein
MPNPSPAPLLLFGNLPRAGEGEGNDPESRPEPEELADIGVHGAGEPRGAEADATRDVGDSSERNPEEKDEERVWVGLRLCCGEGCGWFNDDVMSIRPPPTTPLFRSAERMEFRVYGWFRLGEVSEPAGAAGEARERVPLSCA